ncbi:MAG: DUF3784 domain-containing protein [Gammaproteobacteria bacterium]|nr:DUF3784 domain-containing protein [Gammaproteobacteria bacterium]
MTGKLIEILIMEGIAILLFVFAWQIGIKGKMELIAGYNKRTASRVTDKPGLRRLIARTCLLVGLGSALMPVLTHFAAAHTNGMAHVTGAYGGFIVGVVGMVMLQARDYTE